MPCLAKANLGFYAARTFQRLLRVLVRALVVIDDVVAGRTDGPSTHNGKCTLVNQEN